MPHYILTAAQIIILIVVAVILWQIWKLFNRKDIPDDEPLGDQQVDALNKRLKLLVIFVAAEAVISIIQAILRFIEGL